MDPYLLKIVESIALIAVILLLRYFFRKSTRKMAESLHLNLERKRLMTRTIHTFLSALGLVALVAIWSIDTKQLFFFISSLLTALGIAFFAQWSILSNITASVILFFKHPIKIGESMKILDKDYPIEGKLLKISLIFMHIELENGEHITIPNNVVLNKIISVKMD